MIVGGCWKKIDSPFFRSRRRAKWCPALGCVNNDVRPCVASPKTQRPVVGFHAGSSHHTIRMLAEVRFIHPSNAAISAFRDVLPRNGTQGCNFRALYGPTLHAITRLLSNARHARPFRRPACSSFPKIDGLELEAWSLDNVSWSQCICVQVVLAVWVEETFLMAIQHSWQTRRIS